MELGNILPFFKGLKKITNTTFGKGRKSEVKNPFFLEGNSSVNLLCALSNQKPNATNRLKKKRNDRSGSGSVCESSGSSAFDEMLQSSFTIRLESTPEEANQDFTKNLKTHSGTETGILRTNQKRDTRLDYNHSESRSSMSEIRSRIRKLSFVTRHHDDSLQQPLVGSESPIIIDSDELEEFLGSISQQ